MYAYHQLIQKAEAFCAYQERCQQDIIDKLYTWQANKNEVNEVLIHLISTNFINEERFAIAFTSGKVSIKKWGKTKIKFELKKKKISDVCIRKAFIQVDDDLYIKNLFYQLLKYYKSNNLPQKFKAIKYALSKGFEYDLIIDCIKDIENKKL